MRCSPMLMLLALTLIAGVAWGQEAAPKAPADKPGAWSKLKGSLKPKG